jgi:predicted transposase/invertase (TIGR01784 family)
VEIYGHKLIFLNHHFKNENTPANYRDWLDLFYESIHNPANYKVNLANQGIKRAVELIEYDRLSPEQMHRMKVDSQRKVVRQMEREEGAKNKVREIAKKMKNKGSEIEFISEITGLSKEEIEKL